MCQPQHWQCHCITYKNATCVTCRGVLAHQLQQASTKTPSPSICIQGPHACEQSCVVAGCVVAGGGGPGEKGYLLMSCSQPKSAFAEVSSSEACVDPTTNAQADKHKAKVVRAGIIFENACAAVNACTERNTSQWTHTRYYQGPAGSRQFGHACMTHHFRVVTALLIETSHAFGQLVLFSERIARDRRLLSAAPPIATSLRSRLNMSYLRANIVALVSLLSGAAVVHNIYKPDLVRPRLCRDMVRQSASCCLHTKPGVQVQTIPLDSSSGHVTATDKSR